jgi:hypothetical protein
MLNLNGSDCRVNLDLFVEAPVISFAKVFYETACPRAAIASGRIQTWVKPQCLTFHDGNQILFFLQHLEFVIIRNPGQLQAVNFLILAEQGIVRGPEHRVPHDAPHVPPAAVSAAANRARATIRDAAMKAKYLAAKSQNQKRYLRIRPFLP